MEKEELAVIFGVKRFHQYLFGQNFTIYSDHKPLQHLFRETNAIPAMSPARIQRWALTLGAYNYSIMYKAGKLNANADLLGHLPLPETPLEIPVPRDNSTAVPPAITSYSKPNKDLDKPRPCPIQCERPYSLWVERVR